MRAQLCDDAHEHRRLAAIRVMFQRFGFPTDEADVRARTVYLTQIGCISMQVQEGSAIRMSRVSGYVKTFCGYATSASELARFHARLKFDTLVTVAEPKGAQE